MAASPEVTLREITAENLDAVLALEVREEQRHLVASNAKSIAQAHYTDVAWFRAIYAGEKPVGFVMLALDSEGPTDFVWRLMVDASYQGKGYARRAMVTSLNSIGSQASELSRVKETSAIPDRARRRPPAKIISTVDLPRKVRIRCSPNTQRIPSAMLLLPEPLGPTMAVMPVGNRNSVLVAKDL